MTMRSEARRPGPGRAQSVVPAEEVGVVRVLVLDDDRDVLQRPRELGRHVFERRPDVRGELVLVHQRTTSASSAFWACRRFSAWSQTADCGPYSTSSVISSP